MRLLVVSDLHLEFGPYEFPLPMPAFDVAVFAGDIHQPIVGALKWIVGQQKGEPLEGRPVVYVAGNHEFYNSEMKSKLAEAGQVADDTGIHLLHRRTVVIEGVRFIGCTLWTDYRLLGTPKPSMIAAGQELNDYFLLQLHATPHRLITTPGWRPISTASGTPSTPVTTCRVSAASRWPGAGTPLTSQ